MPIEPLAENPFEILVGRIIDGTLPATPEGIALIAWVCDFFAIDLQFVVLYSLPSNKGNRSCLNLGRL